MDDTASRDRIERIAARCIDATISKIVSDKATPIITRSVSNAIPNQFDFTRFVQAKVQEWGQAEMMKVIERIIAQEHRKATLVVTDEMRRLVKARLEAAKERKPTPKKRA